MRGGSEDEDDEHSYYGEIRTRPGFSDVEYTYEIDLNNLISHEGNLPFFSLRHMPSTEEEFLGYLGGFDLYGNPSCGAKAPVECRWTAALLEPPPPLQY
ncbi:hypothetical protein CYLTODRAFT_422500 [Cylindrobasidium torrendii FP15055 ss-10]|uniref:Uncharacterized protein n=1 Tax=Cylindrobasidium torrendii FP15055 ss-10 TaxID=1314674 RepID=A0A0D7BAC3_9AGAR|nr:hypothetical protein CYLTODRAFT_422500 [Cylindrobasidium torrendii FP15055 ss-10]